MTSLQCCFTSTETTWLIRDAEPRTATSNFTLGSEILGSEILGSEILQDFLQSLEVMDFKTVWFPATHITGMSRGWRGGLGGMGGGSGW